MSATINLDIHKCKEVVVKIVEALKGLLALAFIKCHFHKTRYVIHSLALK
jgi:hypothetical protein